MYKDYTIKEVTEMVNCCYFVGSCRTCPFFKRSGFANIGKCSGEKEVGKALLGILEPLLEAEKAKKQPTLFPVDEGPDMDAIDADPIEAETIDNEEQTDIPNEVISEKAYADEQAGTAEAIAQEIVEAEVNDMFGTEA